MKKFCPRRFWRERLVRPPDTNGPRIENWTWKQWLTPTPRGYAMLGIGSVSIAQGVGYLTTTPGTPGAYALIDSITTATVYGSLWIIYGAAHLISACMRRWKVLMGWSVGVHLAWGVCFLVANKVLDLDRVWIVGLNYALIALLSLVIAMMQDPPVRERNGAEL